VTDEEIIRAAELIPHPEVMRNPDFQTDGRFDQEKYRRWLASPSTKLSGWLYELEAYYRAEIPRRKLFEQLISDVHVTDAEMWDNWRDVHDSAQVSFIALTAESHGDSITVDVNDAEIRRYYDNNKDSFRQTARALVSYVHLPRVITGADTVSARARAAALRAEIVAGDDSAFVAVARRESDDSRTTTTGGDLGRVIKGQSYGAAFDTAAFALRPGQVSQPVLSPVGFHLIQMYDRQGDTASLRHILVEIREPDSVAVVLDRRADSLANIAGVSTDPSRFDQAATALGLTPRKELVFKGQPLMQGTSYVPSISAWAFSGVVPGETSDLFDSPNGFYLARLDSLVPEAVSSLDEVREVVRSRLAQEKKLDRISAVAEKIAARAAASSLETAASENGVSVQKTAAFSRISFVPGLGRDNEAIGAAFAVPAGAISAPVVTDDAVFLIRADRRVNADRDKWMAQRDVQRMILTQSRQQERVQTYMQGLRETAKVVDRRDEIARLGRANTSTL
jgi:peptidyl-prolyl cis-trans isomerase D